MKKIVLSLLASLLLYSSAFGQRSVVVTNTSEIDRKAEMVEVKPCSLRLCFKKKTYVLKNENNLEIPYQVVYNGKKKPLVVIFQVNVKANGSATYTFTEGKPTIVKPKTAARFVPERKDDFAWENDIAAYRMYGPALAKENPSNGVDMWVKRTDEVFMDKMYIGELKNKLSYHTDRGQGMDCYKVGHTLGCGGIAPYASDSLWVGNHFDSYKVLEVGPLRSTFTLTYDSVKVGNVFYKQVITITTNAGSMLNKAVVKFTGPKQKMALAAGIFLHDGKGNMQLNDANGTAAYAEEAISEFKEPSGRNYVGIYIPAKVNSAVKKGEHALVISDYIVGKSFTYYFGGGWNKWLYPTDEDWFKAINQFSDNFKNPLKVKIK
ncbi:MAG: DUF4861 family protein [Paludibacter sp.]